MKTATKCQLLAWLTWIVAATFYSYEFFIRISPAVMVNDLIQAFNVNATMLGTLSAFYYYAYASMQIPVGILLDRYGVRRLLTFAAITVTVGSLLFATTQQLCVAELGRILMGIGSAFSFVGCLKLATNWFPKKQLATVIGLTNMLGVFGAISAEAPLRFLIDINGWRLTMIYVGIVGAVLALLIRLIVRDDPPAIGCKPVIKGDPNAHGPFWQGLKFVLRCRRIWLTAIYGGLMVAPISAFAELWSIPFFTTVDHLSNIQAAGLTSMIFIGIAVGGPINGWISGMIQRRKPIMVIGNIGALLTLSIIIFITNINYIYLIILLFAFGFFTSNMLLIFALNTECNPIWTAGVAIGFTNMVVMIGGTIFQPFVGWLLDLSTQAGLHQTITQLSAKAYQHALLALPLCQIFALIMLFFIRETYCRQQQL